jgi:hypothetical protein
MAYFANGTEGMYLDEQCCYCVYGLDENEPCPIYHAQLTFNYDQLENDKLRECLTMLVDKSGNCKMKEVLDKLCLLPNLPSDYSDLELWEHERAAKGF